ncbi:MAG: hypothetical protein OXL37_06780 [Chloroflexota bacterium]|nr:hypothetical protein [Chloroflexota bacterium]MDE2960797.1 hypothetical protein [Chloroflexota bacterium]
MTVTTDSNTAGTQCGVDTCGIGGRAKQLVGRAIFRLARPGLAPVFGRGLGDDFTPEIAVALTAANQAIADEERGRPGQSSITPRQ